MILRPVSPAEFAVRFGLEPVDVEWLMTAYRRGMSEDRVRCELQTLGCSASEAQRLLERIARETAPRGSTAGGPLSTTENRWSAVPPRTRGIEQD